MTTRSFTEAPSSVPLYLKAALPALPLLGRLPGIKHVQGAVPDLVLERTGVRTDPAHLQAYNDVCGGARGDTVPSTYPHLAAFGLHLMLMTNSAFPFAPMGLVHVRNSITQHRPIGIEESLDISVRAAGLRPHPKGKLVDVITTVSIGSEIVWDETTTLLSRQQGGGAERTAAPLTGVEAPDGVVHWPMAGNLGRRYAAVSGDRNPIHLYPITAKAFGFRSNIAHGMWTKAHCLAALQSKLPDSYTVHVEFRKPILLPTTTIFGFTPTTNGFVFGVKGATKPVTHLTGLIMTTP